MNVSCKICGAQVESGDKFCFSCGAAVEQEPVAKFCTNCGSALLDDAKFCGNCETQQSSSPQAVGKGHETEAVISKIIRVVVVFILFIGAVFLWIVVADSDTMAGLVITNLFVPFIFIILLCRAETLGAISTCIGFGLVGYGIYRNNNIDWWDWYPGYRPGNGMIVVGVLLVFAGVVILALRYWKKHKRS